MKISEEMELRKLAKIGRTLSGVEIQIPPEEVLLLVKKDCERIFEGRVHWQYARNIAMGRSWAHLTRHVLTGSLLADDIHAGKRIYLKNYRRF